METRYLFRGKRIDNGEWMIGNLIRTDEGVYIIQNYVPQYLIKHYEVIPSTICECTGLKDKNGKLIWENDIVKDDVIYGVVKWDDANARHIIDDRDDGYQEYSDWWHEVEVIGNMIDNPELLEV